MDLVNAFNSVNQRSVYFVLLAKGFLEEDIALFAQLYNGSFLVLVNVFGHSAACYLKLGMLQAAQPASVDGA